MKKCVDCFKEIVGANNALRCSSCSTKKVYSNPLYKEKISKSIKESRIKEKEYNGLLYNRNELRSVLLDFNIKKYIGSGKNRSFIKEEPKIYFSILEVSKEISKGYSYKNPCLLSNYTLITQGLKESLCNCGRTLKWEYNNKKFQRAPQCCKLGPNTLKRKILEHGKEKGTEEYQKYWEYNFSQRKNLPYSKISIELFDYISQALPYESKNFYYATKPYKKRVNFNKNDKKIIGENRYVHF